MRNQEKVSYAIEPDKTPITPWRRHRFPNRVTRINFAGETQEVRFLNEQMRERFLRDQKNLVPKVEHKRRQGPYGSHPRHNFNRKTT
jgi:hypothetical protein